jgi:hypothetical protein
MFYNIDTRSLVTVSGAGVLIWQTLGIDLSSMASSAIVQMRAYK